MHQMEVDLEGEVKEREALTKQLRKTEKSLSETTALMTESQESEESLKGHVSDVYLSLLYCCLIDRIKDQFKAQLLFFSLLYHRQQYYKDQNKSCDMFTSLLHNVSIGIILSLRYYTWQKVFPQPLMTQ